MYSELGWPTADDIRLAPRPHAVTILATCVERLKETHIAQSVTVDPWACTAITLYKKFGLNDDICSMVEMERTINHCHYAGGYLRYSPNLLYNDSTNSADVDADWTV